MKKSRMQQFIVSSVIIAGVIALGIHVERSCGPFETRLIASPRASIVIEVPPSAVEAFLGSLEAFSDAHGFRMAVHEFAMLTSVREFVSHQIDLKRGDANIAGGNPFDQDKFEFGFYGPIRICKWGPSPIGDDELHNLIDEFISAMNAVPDIVVSDAAIIDGSERN